MAAVASSPRNLTFSRLRCTFGLDIRISRSRTFLELLLLIMTWPPCSIRKGVRIQFSLEMLQDYLRAVRDEYKTFGCNPVKPHTAMLRRNFNAALVTNLIITAPIASSPESPLLLLSANGKWVNLSSSEKKKRIQVDTSGCMVNDLRLRSCCE